MLIRSQDKKSLINFDNVAEIYTYRIMPKNKTMILPEYETDIICFTGRSAISIGRYSSEEKAIKVINMIENQYLDCCCNLFQMPQDDGPIF